MTMSMTGWLVLIGLAVLIIVINLGLWRALKDGKFFINTTMLNKVARTVRHPWHDEEEQISELARRIKDLKNTSLPKEGKDSSR